MKELQFILNGSTLNNIFPFYILLDEQIVIKGFGNSIAKMMPDIKMDTPFSNSFTVIRPFREKIKPHSKEKR